MSSGNVVFSMAHQSFNKREYDECAILAFVMIKTAIESGNWSEAARCLIIFARCRQATGQYENASTALRQARSVVSMIENGEEAQALTIELDSRIEQVENDSASYESWQRLQAECTALCDSGEFDQAEKLCYDELARARSTLSRRNWYVAAVTRLMSGCCLSRISAMMTDPASGSEQIQARLDACHDMLESAHTIASDHANEHRADWLVRSCQSVHEQFKTVQEKVEEILFREAEDASRRETLLATMDDEGDQPSDGAFLSWQQPFAPILVISFQGHDVEGILRDMHALFIRAEWDQCLEKVQDLLEEANELGHLPMAVVAWVMATRCLAHKGDYGSAANTLGWATAAAASISAPVGPLMVLRLHKFSSTLVNDCGAFQDAAKLTDDCEACGTADMFSHARGILEEEAESNEAGWMAAIIRCLQARFLLLEAVWQRANGIDVDAGLTVGNAQRYLDQADRLSGLEQVTPHWFYTTYLVPARDALYAFLDAQTA